MPIVNESTENCGVSVSATGESSSVRIEIVPVIPSATTTALSPIVVQAPDVPKSVLNSDILPAVVHITLAPCQLAIVSDALDPAKTGAIVSVIEDLSSRERAGSEG